MDRGWWSKTLIAAKFAVSDSLSSSSGLCRAFQVPTGRGHPNRQAYVSGPSAYNVTLSVVVRTGSPSTPPLWSSLSLLVFPPPWLPKLRLRRILVAQEIADEKGAEVAEEIEVDGKAAPSRNPKHLPRNRKRPLVLRTARHLKHLLKLMMLLFAGFVPSLSSITPYLNAIIGPAMYAVLGCVLCTRNSSVHSAR